MPRHLFVVPLAFGTVFATIGGILIGWKGVVLGIAIGLVNGGVTYAKIIVSHWIMRKRGQAK
jgi:hypothetical protein